MSMPLGPRVIVVANLGQKMVIWVWLTEGANKFTLCGGPHGGGSVRTLLP